MNYFLITVTVIIIIIRIIYIILIKIYMKAISLVSFSAVCIIGVQAVKTDSSSQS